jgi:hypothetical protein
VTGNVNVKKFDNFIEYHLDEPITLSLNPRMQQEVQIYFQESETEFFDDIFAFWYETMTAFFQISNVKITQNYSVGSREELVSVKIKLDPGIAIYGRVTHSLFNGLESVGGFYESLIHIGLLFVFYF